MKHSIYRIINVRCCNIVQRLIMKSLGHYYYYYCKMYWLEWHCHRKLLQGHLTMKKKKICLRSQSWMSNDDENSDVFSSRQNSCNDDAARIEDGKPFRTRAAATRKAQEDISVCGAGLFWWITGPVLLPPITRTDDSSNQSQVHYWVEAQHLEQTSILCVGLHQTPALHSAPAEYWPSSWQIITSIVSYTGQMPSATTRLRLWPNTVTA